MEGTEDDPAGPLMGLLLILALLVLLGIESFKALKVRKQPCPACGREMGLWHVEDCHKKGRISPGASMVILAVSFVTLAAVVSIVMR